MSGYYWTLKVKKYDPSQPRVPAGSSEGGRWTSGGAGNGHRRTPQLKTPGARITFNIGGDSDTFRIDGPHGSRGSGYWRNHDFPGESGKRDRGEIFFITAGSRKRAGLGTSIARDMLAVLRKNGTRTVNMSPTTREGRALIAKLVREGDIELIRTSASGKAEYRILKGD